MLSPPAGGAEVGLHPPAKKRARAEAATRGCRKVEVSIISDWSVLYLAQKIRFPPARSSADPGIRGFGMASAKILPRNIAGPQIRRLRFQQGLTQQAFAEKCQRMGWDISRDTMAKVENQTRWLADFEVAFLAEALAVPLDLLLPERGPTVQKIVREFVGRLSSAKPES